MRRCEVVGKEKKRKEKKLLTVTNFMAIAGKKKEWITVVFVFCVALGRKDKNTRIREPKVSNGVVLFAF